MKWRQFFKMLAVFAFACLCGGLPSQVAARETGQQTKQYLSLYSNDDTFLESSDRDEPWDLTFTTNGRLWLWWALEKDTIVTWDYGTAVLMEIARGRGNRIWFGAEYRLSAGFNTTQSITPFDPYEVDTWLYLAWRYQFYRQLETYIFMRRVCFHVVDRHYSEAVFWTHMAFGIGTTSPMENGEISQRVYRTQARRWDVFLSFGPFLHGGPSRIFGHSPSWQYESSAFVAHSWPITKSLILETAVRADWLVLSPRWDDRHRFRVYVRQYLVVQRKHGHASIFLDRVLHDDFIERWHPVGYRIGLEHRF